MEVTIDVRKGEATAREASGEESAPSAVDFDALRLKTIGVFETRLAAGEIRGREELAVLGEHLYVGLFTGEARAFLEERLRQATEDRRLSLRLRLPEPGHDRRSSLDAHLASLPWEYLYCPTVRNGFFLTTRVMLVLSRYLPLGPAAGEAEHREDDTLNVGVIFANPDDDALPAVRAARLLNDLRGLNRRSDVNVDVVENPSLSRVLDWLKDFKPQVLQFIGHGGYDENESIGKIVLVDDDGYSADVTDDQLAALFEEARHVPSVVVLHLPEGSGADGIEPNLARLAPALIRGGVPAVVAMQHPFGVDAARHFSTAFYEALADGDPIDLAVTRARLNFQRRAAGVLDNRAFGTPVLYARAYCAVVRRPLVGQANEELAGGGDDASSAKSVVSRSEPAGGSAVAGGAQRAPVAQTGGGDELVRPGATVINGAGEGLRSEHEGVVRPIVAAGQTGMRAASPPLQADQKAIVYTWFKQLDKELVRDFRGEQLADAMRWEWREHTDDDQLREIARVMEDTARRQEA